MRPKRPPSGCVADDVMKWGDARLTSMDDIALWVKTCRLVKSIVNSKLPNGNKKNSVWCGGVETQERIDMACCL